MTSTNSTGYQVEALDTRQGWRQASRIFANHDDALLAAVNWPVAGIELRVMESLHPAPLTPMQYITEALKGAQRFYRINQGQK